MSESDRATMGSLRPSEMIRAFVALDLDPMSVRRIARLAEHLRMASGAPSATWTAPAKIHVTLKFIGQLPSNAVEPLREGLSAMVEGKSAPQPGGLRLDAFPSVPEADVVIVELADPSGELSQLAEKTNKLAQKLGIPRESRSFRPHVTLARLKRSYDARRWLRPELAVSVGECRPAHLTLYRSHLEPDGSRYEALARFEYRK